MLIAPVNGAGRVRDAGMGRLFPSAPAAGADRQHPAGGERTGLCSPTGRVSHGGLTRINGSPEFPGPPGTLLVEQQAEQPDALCRRAEVTA